MLFVACFPIKIHTALLKSNSLKQARGKHTDMQISQNSAVQIGKKTH